MNHTVINKCTSGVLFETVSKLQKKSNNVGDAPNTLVASSEVPAIGTGPVFISFARRLLDRAVYLLIITILDHSRSPCVRKIERVYADFPPFGRGCRTAADLFSHANCHAADGWSRRESARLYRASANDVRFRTKIIINNMNNE